jgi:plasmid stabilization system protein ParE
MAYRFQVSSQAWRDLRDNIAYIEKENPAAADRMARTLLSRAELLASFPYLGRKIRGRQNGRVLVEDPFRSGTALSATRCESFASGTARGIRTRWSWTEPRQNAARRQEKAGVNRVGKTKEKKPKNS